MSIARKKPKISANVEKALSHDRGRNHDDKPTQRRQRGGSGFHRMSLAHMLAAINFILQLPLTVLFQLNSNPKPLYALMLVSLSYASFLLWIIELVHRGTSEIVTWERRGKLIPLLYSSSPTNTKPFFSFADIVGLLSTACLSIITTLNYALLVQHASSNQIKISGYPIIFAFVLLCSTFWGDRTKTHQPDDIPLISIIIDKPRLECQKSSEHHQDFKATCWRCAWHSEVTIERVFAMINCILELPSAVLDQLSSGPKTPFALILLLLSIASLLLCIIELVYKGEKKSVTWSWKRSGKVLPWPSPDKPFFSVGDMVGLVCAVVQPILSTVNYALVLQHRGQIQISVFPIAFALVLSYSKIWDSPNKSHRLERERNTDKEGTVSQEDTSALTSQSPVVNEEALPEAERGLDRENPSALTAQSPVVSEEVFPEAERSLDREDSSGLTSQSPVVNEEVLPEAERSLDREDTSVLTSQSLVVKIAQLPNLIPMLRSVSLPKTAPIIAQEDWPAISEYCVARTEKIWDEIKRTSEDLASFSDPFGNEFQQSYDNSLVASRDREVFLWEEMEVEKSLDKLDKIVKVLIRIKSSADEDMNQFWFEVQMYLEELNTLKHRMNELRRKLFDPSHILRRAKKSLDELHKNQFFDVKEYWVEVVKFLAVFDRAKRYIGIWKTSDELQDQLKTKEFVFVEIFMVMGRLIRTNLNDVKKLLTEKLAYWHLDDQEFKKKVWTIEMINNFLMRFSTPSEDLVDEFIKKISAEDQTYSISLEDYANELRQPNMDAMDKIRSGIMLRKKILDELKSANDLLMELDERVETSAIEETCNSGVVRI